MQSKSTDRMGLGLVLLSALFLWNPIIGFVDVLPDLFGYLLLYIGLYRLSDLNAHVEEARSRIRVMIWVGIGQLIAMWILYRVMPSRGAEMNPYELPVLLLLCAFALLFFKWFFLIPAYRALFSGLDRLAEKHGAVALSLERRGRTRGASLASLTTTFLVLSTLANTLPEASVLTSFENDVENPLFPFDWYRFVGLFRVFGGVIAAVVGLIWLIAILRYFRDACRDREWLERVSGEYEREVGSQTELLIRRRVHLCFLLLQVGALFAINLRLNSYAVLPGTVLALLSMLAFWLLSKRIALRLRPLCTAGIVLTVASLAHSLTNAWFLQHFLPEASLYQTDAYFGYMAVRILSAVEAIATFFFLWVLVKSLLELVFAHTSVEYEGDVTHALSNAATSRLHHTFEKRAIVVIAFFAAAAAVNLLDAVLLLQLPWIWLISFMLSVAGICTLYSFLHELEEQIGYRYRTPSTHKRD